MLSLDLPSSILTEEDKLGTEAVKTKRENLNLSELVCLECAVCVAVLPPLRPTFPPLLPPAARAPLRAR